jgi:hypothetical protein
MGCKRGCSSHRILIDVTIVAELCTPVGLRDSFSPIHCFLAILVKSVERVATPCGELVDLSCHGIFHEETKK